MKKLLLSLAVVAAVGASPLMVSCSSDDDTGSVKTNPENENVVSVETNITKDTKWTADKVYVLKSRVTVLDGVTLTIEPGTIIKGNLGAGANATALLVARGGKLMAEGTASKPIIFTSVLDEIMPGEMVSPNLQPDHSSDWGGLIILGKAPISAKDDVVEFQIEGIPTSDTNALYGGNEENDNSGVIKYVSIRHGGSLIGEANEINGLTLGGVGKGTVIENIEIVGNKDDGVEFFGGSVNVNNILVWNVGDDAIDTDQNWTGTINGFVVVKPGDNAMELDGPEGSATPMAHSIKNGYILTGKNKNVFNFDDNSAAHISNVKVNVHTENENKTTNRVTAAKGDVTFENVVVSKINGEVTSGISQGDTSGFNFGGFNWTWASKASAWQ